MRALLVAAIMSALAGSVAVAAEPGQFTPMPEVFNSGGSGGTAYAPFRTRAEQGAPEQSKEEAAPTFPIDYDVDLVIANPALRLAFQYIKDNDKSGANKALFGFKPPTQPYPQLSFIQGLLSRLDGRTLESVDGFRAAYILSSDTKFKELALYERARTYLGLKHYIEARADYIIFLKGFPDSKFKERAHLGLARSLTGLKLYAQSISSFQQAGESAIARFGEAMALHQMARYDEADRVFKEAEARYPRYLEESADARYFYGENMRQLGRMFDAKRLLSEVKTGPYLEKAMLGLAKIAAQEGNDEEAQKNLEKLTASGNRELALNARLELAAIKAANGQFADARALLEEIRSRYPYGREYDSAILGLARIKVAEGDYRGALGFLKELIYRPMPEVKAIDEYEHILRAVMKADNVEELKEIWSAVRKWMFDVQREETLLMIAVRMKKAGAPYLDIMHWVEEHGSREGRAKSLAELADYYTRVGSLEKARIYVDRLKTLKEGAPETRRAEAGLLFASRDAAGTAERIMSITNPTDADLALLASVYKKAKDPARAVSYFERAVTAMEDPPASTILLLADILYERGAEGKAYQYYEAVYEKEPGNEWAIYRIAVMSGRDRAEEMYKLISSGSSIVGKMAAARLRDIQLQKLLER